MQGTSETREIGTISNGQLPSYYSTPLVNSEMGKNERDRHSFPFSSVHESGSYFTYFLVHERELNVAHIFAQVQFISRSFQVHLQH